MKAIELLAWGWLFCFSIFSIGIFFGIIVENYLSDTNPIKKWWRKHIVAPDPYDDEWKNFNN